MLKLKSKWISDSYDKFYEKNGYYPKMFNAYNCSEITDVAPTLTSICGCPYSSGCVLILEEGDKTNDRDD